MAFLLFIICTSLLSSGLGLLAPEYSDVLLISVPMLIAALILVWRQRKKKTPQILIDGSNVMYWKDGTPNIDSLHDVIQHLSGQRLRAGIVFDANVGYLLSGKYQHHSAMAKRLGMSETNVMVAPKGVTADQFLLLAARNHDLPIVTNDRYRDWVDEFPEITDSARLIRGGYDGTRLWLDTCSDTA